MRGVSEETSAGIKAFHRKQQKADCRSGQAVHPDLRGQCDREAVDERYARMAAEYESEQKELLEKVRKEEKQLSEMGQKSVDMRLLLQGLREFTDMNELTPTIVNKLIRRIEVHNPEKKHARKSVKVDIYFTAVELVNLPDEQEIRKNDGTDAKRITDTETAHRIKKRCNPPHIGLHHFRYFLLPY